MLQYDPQGDRRCACWLLCVVCIALELAGASLLVAASHHRRAQSVSHTTQRSPAGPQYVPNSPQRSPCASTARRRFSSTPPSAGAESAPRRRRRPLQVHALRCERCCHRPRGARRAFTRRLPHWGTHRPGRATRSSWATSKASRSQCATRCRLRACARASAAVSTRAASASPSSTWPSCASRRRSADGTVFMAGRPSYSHRTYRRRDGRRRRLPPPALQACGRPRGRTRARRAQPAGAAFHRRPPPRAPHRRRPRSPRTTR